MCNRFQINPLSSLGLSDTEEAPCIENTCELPRTGGSPNSGRWLDSLSWQTKPNVHVGNYHHRKWSLCLSDTVAKCIENTCKLPWTVVLLKTSRRLDSLLINRLNINVGKYHLHSFCLPWGQIFGRPCWHTASLCRSHRDQEPWTWPCTTFSSELI